MMNKIANHKLSRILPAAFAGMLAISGQADAHSSMQTESSFDAGIDLTAMKFGKTQYADLYVATQETITKENSCTDKHKPGKVTRGEEKADRTGARQILQNFDADNRRIAEMFGQEPIGDFKIQVEPVPLILQPYTKKLTLGNHSAIHPAPQEGEPAHFEDNITVYIAQNKPWMAPGLADAEVVESYEDRTTNWDSGKTSGEGLSIALAGDLHPEFAENFSLNNAAQAWWESGHKDYINGNPDWNAKKAFFTRNGIPIQEDKCGEQSKRQASDRNDSSNGAGYLFLYYLHDKLGYSWSRIIHANGETLGEKYQSLTGKSGKTGFRDFVAALPKDSGGNLILPPNGNPFKSRS